MQLTDQRLIDFYKDFKDEFENEIALMADAYGIPVEVCVVRINEGRKLLIAQLLAEPEN